MAMLIVKKRLQKDSTLDDLEPCAQNKDTISRFSIKTVGIIIV